MDEAGLTFKQVVQTSLKRHNHLSSGFLPKLPPKPQFLSSHNCSVSNHLLPPPFLPNFVFRLSQERVHLQFYRSSSRRTWTRPPWRTSPMQRSIRAQQKEGGSGKPRTLTSGSRSGHIVQCLGRRSNCNSSLFRIN